MRFNTPATRTMYALFLAATVLELGFGAYRATIVERANKEVVYVPITPTPPPRIETSPPSPQSDAPLSLLDSDIGEALGFLPDWYYVGEGEMSVHALQYSDGAVLVTIDKSIKRHSQIFISSARITFGVKSVLMEPADVFQREDTGNSLLSLPRVAATAWKAAARAEPIEAKNQRNFRISLIALNKDVVQATIGGIDFGDPEDPALVDVYACSGELMTEITYGSVSRVSSLPYGYLDLEAKRHDAASSPNYTEVGGN